MLGKEEGKCAGSKSYFIIHCFRKMLLLFVVLNNFQQPGSRKMERIACSLEDEAVTVKRRWRLSPLKDAYRIWEVLRLIAKWSRFGFVGVSSFSQNFFCLWPLWLQTCLCIVVIVIEILSPFKFLHYKWNVRWINKRAPVLKTEVVYLIRLWRATFSITW